MSKGNPNFASSKFILTMACVIAAVVLAVLDKEVPEGVLVAAIAAYNAANAVIKWRRNGVDNGERV